MSLQRNVLLKESIAVERRRRSSTKDLENESLSEVTNNCNIKNVSDGAFRNDHSPEARDKASRNAISLDDSGSEFPIFVDEENDAVFLPSTAEEQQQKAPKKSHGLQALLNSRILDEETCVVYGGCGGGSGSGSDFKSPSPRCQAICLVKRLRPFRDPASSSSRSRSRSSSFSKIGNGSFSKTRPVRRWTKIDGEWIPIGGVRKRVPGGLKDRLQKLRERRAGQSTLAIDRNTSDKDQKGGRPRGKKMPPSSSQKNEKDNMSATELTPKRIEKEENPTAQHENEKAKDILVARDDLSFAETPWSV